MPSLGWRGSRRGRSAKALPKASGMVRGLATVNGDTLSELSRQPLNRVPTVWGSSRSLAAPRRWTPVHFSPLSPGVGWSTYSNFETVQSLPSTPVPPSSPTFSEPTLPVFALNANAYEYPRRVTTFEENSNGIACNSRPFRLRPITHGSIANGRTFYKPACGLEAIREGIESRRYFNNTDPTVNAQTANALGRNKWSLPVEPKEGTSHHVEPVKATTLTREAASAKIARKNEDVDLHSASSPDSQRLRSWSNPGANPYQKSSGGFSFSF
ncbi:hypothetical protein D918_09676 [Trichuris suis]|nr:hypothetical protein D918_09676 [Trichuris suis]